MCYVNTERIIIEIVIVIIAVANIIVIITPSLIPLRALYHCDNITDS
jgi:hypothetical protein